MEKVGYLEESAGVHSCTRLIFVIGAINILCAVDYMVIANTASPIEIGAFLTAAFAALVALKYFGTKNEK